MRYAVIGATLVLTLGSSGCMHHARLEHRVHELERRVAEQQRERVSKLETRVERLQAEMGMMRTMMHAQHMRGGMGPMGMGRPGMGSPWMGQRAKQGGLGASMSVPPGTSFPFKVKFSVGLTELAQGDKVEITEVSSNVDGFAVGGMYLIKGSYTLSSRDRAQLVFGVQSRDGQGGAAGMGRGGRGAGAASPPGARGGMGGGRGPGGMGPGGMGRGAMGAMGPGAMGGMGPRGTHVVAIERGSGSFELKAMLPRDGWPHIALHGRGGPFGKIYFGQGDTLRAK